MSLQLVANHLAQKGRGPDSTLVHMSNREVAGLQALAQKHGGQLSVNPDTGLPEAGFLDSILPAVAGFGLSAVTGIDPITSAGIVGGLTALDSKDLSKGLVAGLGAYGGAGMAGGLATLGGAESLATATPAQYGAGYDAFTKAPMSSLSALGGGSALKGSLPILAGLAPAAAEAFDEEEGDEAPAQHKGYIRKYALDPVTGQYKQVGVYEAGGDPNVDVSSKAGTAGAFGGVGQSEYEAAQGMASGGATDSSRIYDYLMGRGPNPMQFTHTQGPQVDYNMPKPDAPITPTTGILETPFDQYGNIRGGGNSQSQEQRDEREKAYNTPQDYLSIDRYDPSTGVTVKDVQSQASLAAMNPAERAMHIQDARLQSPIRTAISDAATNVGIIPLGMKLFNAITKPFQGISLNPPTVRDVQPGEFNISPAAMKDAVASSNAAADKTYGGNANNNGPTGRDAVSGDGNDKGQYGAVAAGYTGGSEAADGGLSTPYGFQHMAHGGIANLHQYNLGSYSDGGRLLKGPGDGVSDDIPATIGHGQPARLADGEFVIPARIVSEIGNGSTDAGARELYKMMDRIQAGRKKTVGKDQVARNTKAVRHLPA